MTVTIDKQRIRQLMQQSGVRIPLIKSEKWVHKNMKQSYDKNVNARLKLQYVIFSFDLQGVN